MKVILDPNAPAGTMFVVDERLMRNILVEPYVMPGPSLDAMTSSAAEMGFRVHVMMRDLSKRINHLAMINIDLWNGAGANRRWRNRRLRAIYFPLKRHGGRRERAIARRT